ncbi:nucleoside diphosphate hydrolase [Theileria orientalis strain Shintoku]|uniref:Nucleoside diphosphate hydrolase n=1 Tax=Theileria orientalis strain Shintoku TaxID=869250 RepID=J4DPK1_THEOR|nr:nucleoside diphosphate hydrolase [Theileria orientalis strain Shintoku]PVC53462.1 nucleoside diphosphate hydrolase [Theileria orientalis]BAM40844.1 nucleoside diphosphate hydrolase [Theileria orientalis strain Shintoku]|eukprot:XP_009691145.1 nucleoside diphosphate hydrolase [Theileria orientalis strain Shintoku]
MIDKSKIDSMPNSTEVICMVDKDDKEVGSCTRKEMRLYNEWHRISSTVLLSNPEDPHIFYHIRDLSKEYCPGYVDIAFGGVVSVGESYLENALREVHEECGLPLSEDNVVEIGYFPREDDLVKCHYKVFVALFNGTAEDLAPQKGEVLYIKKIPLSQVDDLLKNSPHTKSCPKILDYIKQFVSEGRMANLNEAKIKNL